MSNTFTFDGTNSATLGVVCSGESTFNAPERDMTEIEIPGRNGNLLLDNKRFKNAAVPYRCFVPHGFPAKAEAVRAWLLAPVGYRRLEDDYHPGEYRLARYAGGVNFDPGFLNRCAGFTVTFDCKPQRFLTSGEEPVTIEASGDTIENPTAFDALPLLHVTGTGDGELTIAGVTVQINGMTDYLDIDCDTMEAFKGLLSANSLINAPEFPALHPGENIVSWSGDITGVTITPRWWTI